MSQPDAEPASFQDAAALRERAVEHATDLLAEAQRLNDERRRTADTLARAVRADSPAEADRVLRAAAEESRRTLEEAQRAARRVLADALTYSAGQPRQPAQHLAQQRASTESAGAFAPATAGTLPPPSASAVASVMASHNGATPADQDPRIAPAGPESGAAPPAARWTPPMPPEDATTSSQDQPDVTSAGAAALGGIEVVAGPFARFSDLAAFTGSLRAMTGVRSLDVRRFFRGNVHFRLRYDDPVPLATRLAQLPDFTLTLAARGPDRLEIRLLGTPGSAAPPPPPEDGGERRAA